MKEAFKIGDIVSSWDVLQFVRTIHYNSQDFVEGDIEERIEEYDTYEVKEILVKDLEEPCYYLDDEYLEEYKEMNPETMPPIVLGFYDDNSYQTIDGGHRTTVANELQLKIIKAFVGIK